MHEDLLSVLSQTERKCDDSSQHVRGGLRAHATLCVTVEDLTKDRARNSARSLRRKEYRGSVELPTRFGQQLRTRHHSPPPRPHLRRSRCRPPRSPSRERQDPRGPPRTRPLPYPHRRTSGQARLEYIRSNLWSIREKTSAMAVELL